MNYDESYDPEYEDPNSFADYLQTNLEENDYEYIDYAEEQIDTEFQERKSSKKPKKTRTRAKREAGNYPEKQDWKCIQCDEKFPREDVWKEHMLNEHEITQPFSCTLCNTKFSANRGLKKHMLLVHSDKRPFPCEHCSFRGGQAYDLVRHMKTLHSMF